MNVTPKSTNGWHKTRFCYFSRKFQLMSKKSATKFLCVKTSSGKVVATSFLYLTVHRWIAGNVPIYQNVALKVTHPFRKRWFRQISLNSAVVPQPWEQARKIQLALIESRPRAFQRAIDKPCTLPLIPPNGGSKGEFLHLALPFISSLQIIVDISNLICGLNIASPSLRMTKRPWNGRGHVT